LRQEKILRFSIRRSTGVGTSVTNNDVGGALPSFQNAGENFWWIKPRKKKPAQEDGKHAGN